MKKLRRKFRIRRRHRKYIPIVFLGTLAVLLSILAIFVIRGEKKVTPTISLPKSKAYYREGDDLDTLKEGVTAKDGDGYDISDSIFVECVIPLSNGREAKVYYVAKDAHNNMAKVSRIVSYTPRKEAETSKSTDAAMNQ